MTDDVRQLRIAHIQAETDRTRSYFLEPVDSQPLLYQPGQFLTLVIPRHGQEIRRSYSLSSMPGEPLRLTIKRVTNGEISRHLFDTLRVGDVLTSLPPAGRFTLDADQSGDLVLLGAGSGISPLFSILKDVLTNQPDRRVTLLYSNTTEASIIFRDELAEWQQNYPDRFRLIHLLSHPTTAGFDRRGRLNNLLLESMLPELIGSSDPASLHFFLCGPSDYMRMARFTLIVTGMHAHQIRREQFVVESAVVESALLTLPPEAVVDRMISLRIGGENLALLVPAHTSILQAALTAGIRLPYSCRGGRCSTCMVHCVTGQVYMTINDVLTARDLDEGWVLTCTGYPMSEGIRLERR